LLTGTTELADRSQRGYNVMGWLAPEASRAAAESELDRTIRQLGQLYPETNGRMRGEVMPFWRPPNGPQRMLARSLGLMQGLMFLLLLAVCGNAANLMLARSSRRQREIGIRLAIGAGPGRIIRLVLTENLLLALLGAGLGWLVAIWGTDALRAVPMISTFPIRFQTRVGLSGSVFTMALGLLCGLIFGVSPAVALARLDPQSVLHGLSGAGFRSRLGRALIGTQAALAIVVLISAALFFRSFRETQNADPGFVRDGLLLANYNLTGRGGDGNAARRFAANLLERVRALPGVQGAAIAGSVPLDIHGMPLMSLQVKGHAPAEAAPDRGLMNTVTPGYFATMKIPFRAGRDFTDLNDSDAPAQAIVNEEFVRRFVRSSQAIGRAVTARGRSYLIVGVVRNSVYEAFGEPAIPMLYRSYRDAPRLGGEIHVRARPGSETLLGSDLRRIARELDPTLDLYDIRTMNEHIDRNAFLRSIPARIFAVLGPLLLALAAIGIYAVVASSVAQRTGEIAVRLALGATARHVIGQIVRETLRVVSVGALIGWLASLLVDLHLAGGVIYLPVFVGVPAILFMVAALACWLPAYRAGRTDPMIALRQE
jgi:predicted permease